jgi:hypothetical protein
MGTSLPRASGHTPEVFAGRERSEHVEAGFAEPIAPVLELRPPVPEPVSPELVLVDPELAQRERARLRTPAPVPATSAPVARPAALWAASAPPHRRPRPRAAPSRRRHSRVVVWATALALAVLGLQYVLQHESPQPILGDTPVRTAARTAIQAPSAAPPMGPPKQSIGLGATTLRTLAWAPVPGATSYELRLYRGSERILLKHTRSTRLTLPERWRHDGRSVRLEPGRYRWNVWALSSGGKLDPKPVVQAQILIARR